MSSTSVGLIAKHYGLVSKYGGGRVRSANGRLPTPTTTVQTPPPATDQRLLEAALALEELSKITQDAANKLSAALLSLDVQEDQIVNRVVSRVVARLTGSKE